MEPTVTDQTAAERVAQAMAHLRVPPSTVYMNGSHNPNMREQRAARDLCRDLGIDPDGSANPVAAEREACADVVWDAAHAGDVTPEVVDAATRIMAAIRNRGETQ